MKYPLLGLSMAGLLVAWSSFAQAAPATPPPTTEPSPAATAAMTGVPGETKEQRDARMAWWREARFGMFIHWGVYSVPAGTYRGRQIANLGEWIMFNGKIPVADYAEFAKRFNPVKFDADEWVKIARDAGMKYIIITAKHHDGFAMFHSAVDKFNIYDATPFKRDPLKELSAACQKYGIKLGFYYSQAQDWNHPGGAARANRPALPATATNPAEPAGPGGHWDPAQDGDFDTYLKTIAIPQVKELLSNYGPVAVLWYDTPFAFMTNDKVEPFLPLHKLQPGLIINNRLASDKKFFTGDTETPEQRIPANGFPDGRDWESCMTINDTWGFKSYDTNFKSADKLIQNLIDIASKGGNYLLNVGPTSEGLIPQPEVDRLKAMGAWLKVNGEAIYGTSPSPSGLTLVTSNDVHGIDVAPTIAPFTTWRATSKPGKIYLSLFAWPQETSLLVTGIKGNVTKAYLLADSPKKPLTIKTGPGQVSLILPKQAPDSIASVICVEISPTP